MKFLLMKMASLVKNFKKFKISHKLKKHLLLNLSWYSLKFTKSLQQRFIGNKFWVRINKKMHRTFL